ncbi:ubiquitin carboxyl-terminal hydrolase 31-like isoform X2 [Homarus americanus]|nr:ubiquitin carboxyl-terminal hydrolase 31-like isoform X2 [Homarus americanus]
MNGHAEPRRKRPFMSFRLSKKPGKYKESGLPPKGDINQIPGSVTESTIQSSMISENGVESLDGGSDSSSASVKPKKKYLTRMSSFVSRVAFKVQGGAPNAPVGVHRGKLEHSKTISVSDLQSPKAEDYVEFEEGKVPGVMGIRNHGNTCFINAVIQCLNHTDVLAEYFVLDQYKHDLARCNKINSKKYGTRGEITEQLAVLLKALWTLRYVPDLSMNFKNTVDKFESIYRGSQQHDAAEFLMFVLDKVHEDLNTASKRKYKKIKNTYGRPDEVVAAETLANHLRCNSSFIHDIFQAQFRSSLKCPHCQKESNTFDPFLCVSIPIPQRQVQSIFVTIVYLNQQPKQVQLGVSIEANASVRELRKQLAEDCGISTESLIITEVDGEGFHRTFTDGASVNVISDNDPIYAIELPPHKPPTQESGAFILVTWVNVVLAEPDNIRFGGVYQSQVVRDVTYVDLQKLLLKEMTTMVTNDTLTSEQESGLFLIGVDDGGSCVVCLDPALDVPLFHESVEQALALCESSAGPPHIKLILQWTSEAKEKYIIDDVDHVDVHSSVKDLKENPQHCASVSLHQCLQLHTSAEKLGCGDAWHCPTCNRKQQVVKRLMLWSAPQILVIHLKRFRQGTLQTNSSKLSTAVKFPLAGFDISDHVAGKPNTTHTNTNVDSSVLGGVWSPWKRPKRYIPHSEDNVYDLYAVCYHHGKDMQGGHYTAMCKNTADNKWYSYDDSKVEAASEDKVVDPDAYILFYQRRSDATHLSSIDGSLLEHWAYRIPLSYLPSSLTPLANKENKVPPPPFERGRSYGTLPVSARNQRQTSIERDHSSDTEAPLASHDESPILKRRSTNTLHENEDSPNDDAPKSNLKIETIKVDVLPTQNGTENGDEHMECDNSVSSLQDSDQEMSELPRSSSGKTVLISRCQALRDQDLTDGSESPPVSGTPNGHAEPAQTDEVAKNEETDVPLLDSRETEDSQEEQTPEVRIHPATPEVLAAHQGHTEGQPKRSVITLTLRPRNPSECSSGGVCESRVRVVSRTPSVVSSCSTASNTSNPVVNGVDHVYQNGNVDDHHREKIFGLSSDLTPEVRITPLPKSFEQAANLVPSRVSTRCTNANKTASFVVINTPSVSPRAPRPKTPISSCLNGSPRPFPPRNPTKPRDSSADSFKNQRPMVTRKENMVSTKQSITNCKNQNLLPSVSYCGSVKNCYNGVSAKIDRFERGDFKCNSKCDKRDLGYEREDKYKREQPYFRDSVYDRELKGDNDSNKYERDCRYNRDIKYTRDSRYDGDLNFDNDFKFDRDLKFDRDIRCDRDYKYDRVNHCDRDYDRGNHCDREYDRVNHCDRDYDRMNHCDRDYDRVNHCDRDYDRVNHCDRDYKYEREGLCEREYEYNGDSKSNRDFRYDRDLAYDRDSKYDLKYSRGEARCERDCIYERGESRDHCPSQEYPKGLPNTATNPPVITESSV